MAALVLYGIGGLVALVLGAIFWGRAIGTRRTQRCKVCGTPVTTELMTAASCNTCGALLP